MTLKDAKGQRPFLRKASHVKYCNFQFNLVDFRVYFQNSNFLAKIYKLSAILKRLVEFLDQGTQDQHLN
jgi:hypothetical protein